MWVFSFSEKYSNMYTQYGNVCVKSLGVMWVFLFSEKYSIV